MHALAALDRDAAALAISVGSVIAYYVFLHFKVRGNPTYTIHGVNALARSLWVENVMRNASKDVMAVQTLRNFVMGASLMASTAALLIIGTLSLSGQADHMAHTWMNLGASDGSTTAWSAFKVTCLLADFIIAFFAFVMSVRLANHVVFMVNVPDHGAHHSLAPQTVARRLQRAGNLFAVGMRAFFFAVPLVFWLFGPHFLVLASFGLVVALYHLDRSESGAPDLGRVTNRPAQVVHMSTKLAKP